ncbi:MAG: cytochrome c biogenesis protein [Chloroflexota bacterium]
MSSTRLNRTIPFLNWLSAAMVVVSLLMTFFFAPNEITMGNVQRIFYFHVGSAWVAAVAYFVALVAGVLYLRRPERRWDTLAMASVEIGLVFTTMTTAAGSIWGRPAWNTWWLWSPRLTLITVMWLVYVAYFMLRGAVEDEGKRGRFAAVYVIAAFVTVLMTYFSVRLLRDIHPVVFGGTLESAQGATEGLQEIAPGLDSARMGITLTVATLTFSLLYLTWLLNRIRLQGLMDEVTVLKMKARELLVGHVGNVTGPVGNVTYVGVLWQAADPNQFNNYMLLGYVVMWLIGLGYVYYLANRQRNLRQDILLLRQLLQEE